MQKKNVLKGTGRKLIVVISLALATFTIIIAASKVGSENENHTADISVSVPSYTTLNQVLVTTPTEEVSQSYDIDSIPEDVAATGVLTANCELLAEPDDGADTLCDMLAGEVIYIRFSDGIWYLAVTMDGQEGYVMAELVNTGGVDAQTICSLAPMPGMETTEATTSTTTTLPIISTTTTTTRSSTQKTTGKTTTAATTTSSNKIDPKEFPTNSSPYFIYVEKGSHTITIYAKDENGRYTKPIRSYLTATGRTSSLTPVGLFQIGGKEKWHAWSSTSFSPYASVYRSGLFFHGPLYNSRSFGALRESSVRAIGTNASSGCMRTSAEAAYFIYQFCPQGTYVKIVSGSPLGKFANAPSISSQYVDPATGRVPVTGVSISPESLKNLEVGQTFKLSAAVTPERATEKGCTWLSSDTSVVTVNSQGGITARGVGTATVTCTTIDGNYVATCSIIVKDPNTTTSTTSTATTTTTKTAVTTSSATTTETTSTTAKTTITTTASNTTTTVTTTTVTTTTVTTTTVTTTTVTTATATTTTTTSTTTTTAAAA